MKFLWIYEKWLPWAHRNLVWWLLSIFWSYWLFSAHNACRFVGKKQTFLLNRNVVSNLLLIHISFVYTFFFSFLSRMLPRIGACWRKIIHNHLIEIVDVYFFYPFWLPSVFLSTVIYWATSMLCTYLNNSIVKIHNYANTQCCVAPLFSSPKKSIFSIIPILRMSSYVTFAKCLRDTEAKKHNLLSDHIIQLVIWKQCSLIAHLKFSLSPLLLLLFPSHREHIRRMLHHLVFCFHTRILNVYSRILLSFVWGVSHLFNENKS